ncbi:MAG: HU family DNA-binding protein [Ruminococcus sp.]|nr:HU family DNA-binding protein [Ruminococcus sp.]
MKKAELVNAIAEKGGYTKKDAEKALNAVIESITDVLVAGDKITLVGFGTFKTKVNPERMGRNPRTKEEKLIPEKTVPVFKAGQALKDAVNK